MQKGVTIRKKILGVFIFIISVIFIFGQDGGIDLNNEYADIKADNDNEIIKNLLSSDRELVNISINKVLENIDTYNPVVLYVFSNIYFDQNKDEASKIFYIGQLRARIDANICLDVSARQAVSILNDQFGHLINKYALKNTENLKRIVEEAIEHVRKFDISYDRRWINLHGIKAFFNEGKKDELMLSEPKEKWSDIINSTIEDYEKGFQIVLKKLEKNNI